MQAHATEALRAAIAALETQCATELNDTADRERLIQAIPEFRDNVAAYGRRGAAP
jgi:hypothetical protein